MSLYYESHITVEPVFDERLAEFERLCSETLRGRPSVLRGRPWTPARRSAEVRRAQA